MHIGSVAGKSFGLAAGLALLLSGCGGSGDGPQVTQKQLTAQTISLATAPALAYHGTAVVSATASSGLPVTYTSTTTTVCSVDGDIVTDLATGTCTIAVNQAGNSQYAAAAKVTLDIPVSGGTVSQVIAFDKMPSLSLHGTATVTATASSGLAVVYSSTTPSVCTVDASSGVVTDVMAGTCIVTADQPGADDYAAAPQVTQTLTVIVTRTQTVTFTGTPTLTVGSTATTQATASSGLPVTYASTTPATCSVVSASGVLTGFAVGSCTITAEQPGNAEYDAAPQVSQTLIVGPAPVQYTVPGKPTGVKATLGDLANTVLVAVGTTQSGGTPITGYAVTSSPAGITGNGTTAPITVNCPVSCAGYAFSVAAINSVGTGTASSSVHVVTNYKVVETFYEPDTQPRNSIFIGTFTFDSTTKTVSNLRGSLSESMTGDAKAYPNDNMTWIPLNNQLSAVTNTSLGGILATTFALTTANTFTTSFGGDGWSPDSGVLAGGIYDGFPSATNPSLGGVGNSYAMIFVNTANPAATPTVDQINKLAYADCAAGGMMGAVCMTGTTVAGYGGIGTMSGYPVSQVITKQ